MTKRQKRVKEIFEENGIHLTDSEVESVGRAIGDTLEMVADDIEVKEPYATVTIAKFRNAGRDIENELEEEEEE